MRAMDFVMVEELPAANAVVPYVPAKVETPPAQPSQMLARLQRIKSPPVENRPVNKRFSNRRSMRLTGRIEYNQSHWADCSVLDMSAGGAQIEVSFDPRLGKGRDFLPEVFDLVIESLLERSAVRCQVRWHNGKRAGVLFLGPIDATIKRLPRRGGPAAKIDANARRIGAR